VQWCASWLREEGGSRGLRSAPRCCIHHAAADTLSRPPVPAGASKHPSLVGIEEIGRGLASEGAALANSFPARRRRWAGGGGVGSVEEGQREGGGGRGRGRTGESRVSSLRGPHTLKVSFQYNERKADSIVLESICGRLRRSTIHYISKTFRPFRLAIYLVTGHGASLLWRCRQSQKAFLRGGGELQAMPGSRFAGGGGAAGIARQPYRDGRRHWFRDGLIREKWL